MNWHTRWSNVLRDLPMAEYELSRRRSQGLATARSGRVMDLVVSPGRLSAKVQGGRATPFLVNVEVKQLPKADWDIVISTLANTMRYCARLLATQEPDGLATELLDEHGIHLFPQISDITFVAGHGIDESVPVVGIAVWEAMGQLLRQDPFVLFQVRGRTKTRVMRDITKARKLTQTSMGLDVSQLPIQGWNKPRGAMDRITLPTARIPKHEVPALTLLGNPEGWKGALSAVEMFGPSIIQASHVTLDQGTPED